MSDYPPGMTLRPIDAWPRPETRNRQRSQFSAPWSETLRVLDRELHHLGAGNRRAPSVLQIAMRERDFRIDGLPRANAIPSHPGVILNVESNKGPLSFPCDKFDRWQDNLRAIALSLEALRKVDRYGTTPGNEQYRGWQAIEAAPSMTAKAAVEYLASVADMPPPSSEEGIALAYKKARRVSHPDRSGDRATWDRVEAAAAVLRNSGYLDG